MTRYDISYQRLALALVPLAMRQPVLMAFLYVLLSPVVYCAGLFERFRTDTDYRLTHNGQVCYLTAVLNDRFDPVIRRITITDVAPLRGNILYHREADNFLMAPHRNGSAVTLNRRAFSGSDSVDFAVIVPATLRGTFPQNQMQALINTYKLASKRYIILYQ